MRSSQIDEDSGQNIEYETKKAEKKSKACSAEQNRPAIPEEDCIDW